MIIDRVDHETVRGAVARLTSCSLSQLRDRVLDGTLSPQLVLRLGWPPVGPPLPVTPRRAYQEEER